MKVFGYTRLNEQRVHPQNMSLEQQAQMINSYATQQGWHLTDTISDIGKTSASLKLPNLQQIFVSFRFLGLSMRDLCTPLRRRLARGARGQVSADGAKRPTWSPMAVLCQNEHKRKEPSVSCCCRCSEILCRLEA